MAETERTRPRTRLWLRLLFGVSLALNLAVLGFVGGMMVRFGGPDAIRPPPHTIGAVLFRELPRGDQHALRAETGRAHGDRHARQRADAMAISAAVRAIPFDPAALNALLDEQATRRTGIQQSAQQAWLVRVAGMSQATRTAYADRLEQALNRPRFKSSGRDHQHD